MSTHKNLIESLADDRHSKRYRRGAGHVTVPTEVMRETRSRAGWLLVGIGLRLALPRGQERSRTTTALGR